MPNLTTSLHFLVCNWILSLLTLTGFSNYLLQCFQVLVHSQSISQCSGSRFSNSIHFKTVKEQKLAQRELIVVHTNAGQHIP